MARIWLIASIGVLSFGAAACGDYDEKNAAYDGNNAAYEAGDNAAYDETGNAAYDTSGNNAVYAPPPVDGNASTDNMIGAPPPADPAVNNY
jgi:hypothetical protein